MQCGCKAIAMSFRLHQWIVAIQQVPHETICKSISQSKIRSASGGIFWLFRLKAQKIRFAQRRSYSHADFNGFNSMLPVLMAVVQVPWSYQIVCREVPGSRSEFMLLLPVTKSRAWQRKPFEESMPKRWERAVLEHSQGVYSVHTWILVRNSRRNGTNAEKSVHLLFTVNGGFTRIWWSGICQFLSFGRQVPTLNSMLALKCAVNVFRIDIQLRIL